MHLWFVDSVTCMSVQLYEHCCMCNCMTCNCMSRIGYVIVWFSIDKKHVVEATTNKTITIELRKYSALCCSVTVGMRWCHRIGIVVPGSSSGSDASNTGRRISVSPHLPCGRMLSRKRQASDSGIHFSCLQACTRLVGGVC